MCHKDLTNNNNNNNNAMNNDRNRLPTVLYPYNNSIEQLSCDPNIPFFINEVASSINTRHHYIIHSNDAIIRNQSFIHAENTIRSINNNHTVGFKRLPGHWEFYEDRKGKPGWIIEGDFMHHNNSSIHNSNNNNDAHISHSILLSERKDILSKCFIQKLKKLFRSKKKVQFRLPSNSSFTQLIVQKQTHSYQSRYT